MGSTDDSPVEATPLLLAELGASRHSAPSGPEARADVPRAPGRRWLAARLAPWCGLGLGFAAGAVMMVAIVHGDGAPVMEQNGQVGATPSNGEETLRRLERIVRDLEACTFAPPITTDGARQPGAQRAQHLATAARVLELTEEWHRIAPLDPALPRWLDRRWSLMTHMLGRASSVAGDVARLRNAPGSSEASIELQRAEWLALAEAAVELCDDDAVELVARAEECGCDPVRVALAWCGLAARHATSLQQQTLWTERARALAGDHRDLAHPLDLMRARLEQVGSRPEFSFDDVRTGRRVDLQSLRGAPVLLVAWSNTSPASSEVIQQSKRLVETWKEAGLVVLGLHEWRIEGGPAALLARLAELEFDVPHFYEEPAAPWEGRLRALGVRCVPWAILLDREGRIVLSSERVAALEPGIVALCARTAGEPE